LDKIDVSSDCPGRNMDGLWGGALRAFRHSAGIQAASIAEYVEVMRRMEIPPRTLHAWYKNDCRWSHVCEAKPTKYAIVGWVAVDPLLPRDMEHLVTGAYKRLAVSEGGQLYYLFEDGNTRRASPALIPLPYQAPSFDGFLAPTLPDLLGRGITRALYRAHHLSL
jgi:hypothetical protein